MEFKPLTFTLYSTFPKIFPRNQLQIGHEKDYAVCRKEENSIMNIQTKIYD